MRFRAVVVWLLAGLDAEQFEGVGLERGRCRQAREGVFAVADPDFVAAERAEVGEQVFEAVCWLAVGGAGAAGFGGCLW